MAEDGNDSDRASESSGESSDGYLWHVQVPGVGGDVRQQDMVAEQAAECPRERTQPKSGFNQLSINQTSAILGFLDYQSVMRSRIVCKKICDAAKTTIVTVYDKDRYQYLQVSHLVGGWSVVG